jgi:S-adenosylmethionine synthetase
MARYVAKNIVAAGLADRCEIQLSYAIGDVEPFSLSVSCFGTEKMPEPEIEKLVREQFDLSPAGMIKYLDLRRPIYKSTAAYGHFGWSYPERKWEQTDMAEALKKAAGV